MKPHPILSTSFLSGYRNNPPLFFTLKSNFSFKSHGILSLSPVITSCSLSLPSAIFSLKPRSVIKFAPRLTRLLCSSVLAHQATATLNPELAALPDDLIQQGPKLVFRTTRREGAKTVFRWATRAASRDRIKGEKSQEIESISASAASRVEDAEQFANMILVLGRSTYDPYICKDTDRTSRFDKMNDLNSPGSWNTFD